MNNLMRHLSVVCKRQRLKLPSRTIDNTGVIDKYKSYRKIHTSRCSSALLTCLKSRGIIQLQGADTVNFLQGLVTNDVSKLMENEHPIQYSLMLNVQGRILYDLFIYNTTAKNGSPVTLFIDVPATASGEFISMLRRYKLRKKVDISDVSSEFQVWSQFQLKPETNVNFNSSLEDNTSDAVICCPDPRMAEFGRRLIRREPFGDDRDVVDESIYKESRYRWGLPEGISDLPPGNCFPLESNAVFMNGVNFEKGCYIGQELTARTYHTGVTRKRLMPLVFENVPPEIEMDVVIKNEKNRNAGKFRGSQSCFGLGLVRLAHIKENLSLTAKDGSLITLTTHVPHWWPEFEV